MSFDLFFQPCRYGEQPVRRINPFTKQSTEMRPTIPLNDGEVKAVKAVFTEANAKEHDGAYVIDLPDGGSAEVFGGDTASGCMFAVRGLTQDLLGLMVDMLQSANWLIIPAMPDAVAIISSKSRTENLPETFPQVVVCDSAADLGAILTKGFDGWLKYRDQVSRD